MSSHNDSSHNDERRVAAREGLSAEGLSTDGLSGDRLSAEESRFVKSIAEGYAPAPMTSARRVSFDDALRERIEGRRSPWPSAAALWVPAAATAVMATVWLFSGSPRLGSAPGPATTITVEAWEEVLLSPDIVSDLDTTDYDEDLPEDYLAIASAFL
ncbi:MAG: hypothetical protein JRG96_10700 [Deltaproteobacteria bacterium]|nr:hypothetical protein [Deltaproteobacteria bacterium]MBW2418558.1 hypothetical protein [Deltaproteobacteria bacterium]